MMTNNEKQVASYLRDHGSRFDGGGKASRAELATQWMDCFSDPFECADWMAAGFWCPQTACAVSYLGIRPADVAALCANLSDHVLDGIETDPVYAFCNGDLDEDVLRDNDDARSDDDWPDDSSH